SVEIQSHRASSVQRHEQKLGRRATAELREDPEVHPHHNHRHGAESEGLSGPEGLPAWRQALCRPDAGDPHHPAHPRSEVELYNRALKCEIIPAPLLSPLETQRKEKLHRIWKQLLEIYNPENALLWLESSVPVLGYRRPVDIMAEDGGLDRVLDVVGRMSWGIPS